MLLYFKQFSYASNFYYLSYVLSQICFLINHYERYNFNIYTNLYIKPFLHNLQIESINIVNMYIYNIYIQII